MPVREDVLREVYEKKLAETIRSEHDAEQLVMSAYEKAEDGIVVLSKFAPFQKCLCDKNAYYVIFPSVRGGVNVQCVPVSPNSFDVKIELPDWSVDSPDGLIFEFGAGNLSKTRFLANFETEKQAYDAVKKHLQTVNN